MTVDELKANIGAAVAEIRKAGNPARLIILTSQRMGALLAGDGPPPASIVVGGAEIAIRYSEVVSPGTVFIADAGDPQ